MKEKIEPLFLRSKASWRLWLSRNHKKIDFVWLALKKKNSEKKGVVYLEAVEEVLCFGWIDGIVKKYNDDFYIQRFTPRKKISPWSKINKDKALKLIKEGRMTKSGMDSIAEARKNGRWEKAYSTPRKMDIPEDLIKALKRKAAAYSAFMKFPPSHQHMYSLWVNDAKKEETRKRRIEKVISMSLQKTDPRIL
jgi:uncharacterized protein YdeI (YjbR/CyaY-like superfamily)